MIWPKIWHTICLSFLPSPMKGSVMKQYLITAAVALVAVAVAARIPQVKTIVFG